jgi:hypothetical protein
MATLQNLMDDTRIRLADLEDVSYTQTMLASFANEGQKKMAESLCCTEGDSVTNILSSWLPFTELSRNPLTINLVRMNGTKIGFSTLSDIDGWDQDTDEIDTYIIWEEALYFNKALTDDDVVVVNYTFSPANLVNTSDVSEIPEKFIYGVVSWMEYRCRALDREGGLAERAYNEYVEAKTFASVINQANLFTGGYEK